MSVQEMIDKGATLTQPIGLLVQDMLKGTILTQSDEGWMQEMTDMGKSQWSWHLQDQNEKPM